MSQNTTLKFAFVGSRGSGKSSIIRRFVLDTFQQDYRETVGLDLYQHEVSPGGNKSLTIQIWDISGSAVGSRMLSNFLYASNAIFIIYDITNFASFRAIEEWMKVIRKMQNTTMPRLIIMGNKSDRSHLRVISWDDHQKLCLELNALSYIVSAQTNDSIGLPFMYVSAELAGYDLKKLNVDDSQGVVKAVVKKDSKQRPQDANETSAFAGKERDDNGKCELM